MPIQKPIDLAREMDRIVAANRYTLMRQPSHTGIPHLVTLVEDLVRLLDKTERKTYTKDTR